MASSPASNGTWGHDVFLSFHGRDARDSICKKVFDDLVKRKIKAFMDVNHERGKPIKQILDVIEESQFSIVIFSKNFAWSKFCLKELVKMVRCIKKKGHTVFPIFYHVKAADVEDQTGDYKLAFDEHEKNCKSKTVKTWRNALKRVAGIAGWSAKNYAGDEELARVVADQIFDKLHPTSPGTSLQIVPYIPECMYSFQEWEDVHIVWMYGVLGGIHHNTAFPRAVYDAVASRNVPENWRRCSVQVPSQFSFKWRQRRWDPSNEINDIKIMLRQKKVLLIVDDVEKQVQLVDLAIEAGLMGPRSRIILSAKDPREWNHINVHNISINHAQGEGKIFLDVLSFLGTPFSYSEIKLRALGIEESLAKRWVPTTISTFKFLTESFMSVRGDFPQRPQRGMMIMEVGANIDQHSAADVGTGGTSKKRHFRWRDLLGCTIPALMYWILSELRS